MGYILVTNNHLLMNCYLTMQVTGVEGTVLDLYKKVRDYIHRGCKLYSHPLSGSLKPGQIPYKSVIIVEANGPVDQQSLILIENSIETYYKTFREDISGWPAEVMSDYALIDRAHIQAALESLGDNLNTDNSAISPEQES